MKFESPYTPEQLRIRLRDTSIFGFRKTPSSPRFYVLGWYRKGKFRLALPFEPELGTLGRTPISSMAFSKGRISASENGSDVEIRFLPPWYGVLFVAVWSAIWIVAGAFMSWDNASKLLSDASVIEWGLEWAKQFVLFPLWVMPVFAFATFLYGYKKARKTLFFRLKTLMEWKEK